MAGVRGVGNVRIKMSENIKLKTNLDTNFLKLIAVISMIIDHIGFVFFSQYPIFRWIGRIAFPIFCYCMTVGVLYTKNIRNYLLRLAIFAIISQPFWILAFNYDNILGNIFNFNIFFTLFINLLGIWGFKEKKYWLFVICILLLLVGNFDYSITGIMLMLIFYIFRNEPKLGLIFFILLYLPALFRGNIQNPLDFVIFNYPIRADIFAIFAAPFIFLVTEFNLKIQKVYFYLIYPIHLFVIFIFRLILKI